MITFNELLCAHRIDPSKVAILRHSGRGPHGITTHDLWLANDGSFDKYQSTQAPNNPVFESPYWASFVATPENETLFAGLYGAVKVDSSEIDWLCPLKGISPGQDKARLSDLYRLSPLDPLIELRGALKIVWDKGWVAWARYADRNDFPVLGEVDAQIVAHFDGSAEGAETWSQQRILERDPKLSIAALKANALDHGGRYTCEACDFEHSDRAMFDAHHLRPLLAGHRMTRVSDLAVLCPVCHRRAHRSPARLQPFGVAELRAWNNAGRP